MIGWLLRRLGPLRERYGLSAFFLWRLAFYVLCLLILGGAKFALARRRPPPPPPPAAPAAIEISLTGP